MSGEEYDFFFPTSEASQQIYAPAFVEVKKEMNTEWQSHLFKGFQLK